MHAPEQKWSRASTRIQTRPAAARARWRRANGHAPTIPSNTAHSAGRIQQVQHGLGAGVLIETPAGVDSPVTSPAEAAAISVAGSLLEETDDTGVFEASVASNAPEAD